MNNIHIEYAVEEYVIDLDNHEKNSRIEYIDDFDGNIEYTTPDERKFLIDELKASLKAAVELVEIRLKQKRSGVSLG